MKGLSPNHLALLVPVSFLAHQLEEYFGSFPGWFSDLLNADLSNQDFIIINAIGLILISGLAFSFISSKNNMILAVLGTIVLVNGIVHLALSLFTFSYSPGVITGVLFFLPLGITINKKIFPQLSDNEKNISIAIGVIFLFSVSLIAYNL